MSSPASATPNPSLPLPIDAVVKRFGQVIAVDSITLELRAGECLGLLGPNGAGKSTLIRSIVGRAIPEAGTISVFGAPTFRTRAKDRSTTFIQFSFTSQFSVQKVLTYAACHRREERFVPEKQPGN